MLSAAQFVDVPETLCWDHCQGRCRTPGVIAAATLDSDPAPSEDADADIAITVGGDGDGGGDRSEDQGLTQVVGGACCCSRYLLVNALRNASVVFVGAGLSSIEAAKVVLNAGGQPLLLERSAYLGGIWVSAANPESRVQVDPISFRAVDDTTPVLQERDEANPFDSRYPNRATVLRRLANSVEAAGLRDRCVFNTEVVAFEKLPNGHVKITVRQNGAEGFNRPQSRWPSTAAAYAGDGGGGGGGGSAESTVAAAAAGCPCCAAADGEYTVEVRQLHMRTGSLTHGLHRGLRLSYVVDVVV